MATPPLSSRRALNILIHAMQKDLLQMQDRILRAERFGPDAIAYMTVPEFENVSLAGLKERHAEMVTQIRELKQIAQNVDEASILAFVRSRQRA
jgi:hypothetical protein